MRKEIISILVELIDIISIKLMAIINLTKIEIISFYGSNHKPDQQKHKITFQNTITLTHDLQNWETKKKKNWT